MKGLSSPEEVIRLRFPAPVYDLICGKDGHQLFELEQDTGANIVFYSSELVEISGWISGVTKASGVIEDIIKTFIEEHNPTSRVHEDDEYGPDSQASVEEDSGIYMKCTHGADCQHDQEFCSLNRHSVLTVDDDLEDHHLSTDSIDVKSKCSSCQTTGQIDEELMEYAKKLGYSEVQVKSAMKKLGAETLDQNELLHELIKASNSIGDVKILGDDGKADMSAIQGFYASVNDNHADASFLRHIVVDGSNVAMR